MKRSMEPDDESGSPLRIKIAELEHELREERERFDLLQFEACQDVEKHTRECSSLRENAARLEEDCAILRDRELKDRERIKSLMEEIGRKEIVFKEKFVELKAEISDLKEEILERKKKEERGKECGELEARAMKLAEENFRLLDDDIKVNDEMLKRSGRFMQKRSEEDLVLTPEPMRKRVFDDEDDEEDRIPTVHLINCNEIGDSMKPPRKKLFPRRMCGKGKFGLGESLDKMEDDQIPISAENKNRRKVAGTGLRSYFKRNSKNQKSGTHTRTIAYSKKQLPALDRAKEVQSSLKFSHPSFIKSMLPSYVSSCFWLGLPTKFCKENLSDKTLTIVLEDEKGLEHYAIYIGSRVGLSGGWRGFALDHKLEVGDALVFELIEPTRFKVYIIKANQEEPNENSDVKVAEENIDGTSKRAKHYRIRNTRRRSIFSKKPRKY